MISKFIKKAVILVMILTLSGQGMMFPAETSAEEFEYPFRNPNLSIDERVDDLLSRLTLDEKVSLLHQYQPAIPRLGIDSFRTGTEGLHGVAWLGEATVFPEATGLANTWDKGLIEDVGSAVGDEVRAFHKKYPEDVGLSVWAPVVDLQRDPRHGRNEESYGEDPVLAGEISTAYADGLNGDDGYYLKTIPTLKHFLGYNNEENRGASSSSLDPRNLYEYQLKSFEPAISSQAAYGMMPAYNAINGKPANLSPLINELVKGEWASEDFHVVSDAWDVSGLVNSHKYVDTMAEAVALSIKAGVDSITDQDANSDIVTGWIHDALDQGLLTEADIDKATKNNLRVRFRLGEFDPEGMDPYADIDESVINSEEHQDLALEAARKQLVLLKNEDALPLDKDDEANIAVIGPLADQVLTDFYSGTLPYSVSTLDGIKDKISEDQINFTRGLDEIALKSVKNNQFVSALASGDEVLKANADEIGTNETYYLYDYGWDQFLLRAKANDKYLSNKYRQEVINDGKAPGLQENEPGTQDWFTYENYNYEAQEDGTYALYNYQVDNWGTSLDNGKYVTVNDDAQLIASERTVGEAEKFEQVIVSDGVEKAKEAAKNSEAAIVVVGDQPQINARETIDRQDISLPPSQVELIEEVASVNENTIVVLVSGNPMAIPEIQDNPNVKAILYSSHGGQEEGNAIADALFGAYAPAGRLNQTWYASVDQLGEMMEYDIIKDEKTYLYFEGDPLYSFGHGLTYTDFEYSNLRVSSHSIKDDEMVKVSVDVTNTGDVASDEVVQLYTSIKKSRVKRPIKELKNFDRVYIEPGETKRVSFELDASDLAFWDVTREKYTVESGNYSIMIGRSSSDIQLKKNVHVHGERVPFRDLTKVTKAENYDDYHNVKIVEEAMDADYAVGEITTGSWIAFKDVRFNKGVRSFTVRVASEQEGGTIEIRTSSPTGKIVGEVDVPVTGDLQEWTKINEEISRISGKSDVYLVFHGSFAIDSFNFDELQN
ncbi:glycoside hydrolase family 3 protein [Pseudalkalibacillus salsuginis]|uniref:glycoside hydrolase family 3 protein n=1 Tax=Pseudalkalibacillus salsuginis TaxID=2910972 RepID=UPI001F2E4E3D|nr:glycoside hydrolase family 3 protein [Pseudalkalibacillus salsuginis]MCF6409637.1 glycoside hydrolase family 3 C-terminal domain-containing protein [Pseudalkalibacillus salsuginis]